MPKYSVSYVIEANNIASAAWNVLYDEVEEDARPITDFSIYEEKED